MSGLLHVLHCSDIVELGSSDGVVQKGPLFAEVYRDKGYFLWLVGGYGRMLQNLSRSVRDEHRNGDFVYRDGKYIAIAARDYGSQFVDPHFTDMIGQMAFQVGVDLGCGSAERLIHLAKLNPDFSGIGIDINPEAVRLARELISEAKLEDRIIVIHADVRALTQQSEFAGADVVFSFFMGHDLWPRPVCLKTLRSFRTVFPRVKRFLFCDTYRSDLPASAEVPIFTLGFELTHAVMGQYIPSLSEWMDLFEEAGWNCAGQRDVGIPFSAIFDLR